VIDYRLTDSHLEPPDDPDMPTYAEEPVRLPDFWCCYDPLTDIPPRPPEQSAGPMCFGSMNNPCKHNESVLRLWSRVLHAVPDSRLLLLAPNLDEYRKRVLDTLAVDESRVEFVTMCPRGEYLRRYDRIDIALDTLPHNGIT